MSFFLGLWFVCGFLANLPTASSIQCYACADYPGSNEPCNENSPVIQCEWYFDSCSSLTTTIEIFGFDFPTITKNCSSTKYTGCDSTFICDLVNSSMVTAGGSVKQCDLSCCNNDLCNGGGRRGKRALNEIYAAINNEEQQKRAAIIDELEKNAAEFTKKLETKRGRSKKRAAFSQLQKKREAKSEQLMGEAMKTIQEGLARLVLQKR